MALDDAARQELLAQPLTPILAIDRPGHPPIAVPVWHQYSPGGDAWIMVGADSEKARLLRDAGGATLVVQEVHPRTRYASASCELVSEHVASDAERRELAERYLPASAVDGYLEVAAGFGPEVVLVLRPIAWRAADLTIA